MFLYFQIPTRKGVPSLKATLKMDKKQEDEGSYSFPTIAQVLLRH
jgi:hypothetical protein